MKKLSHVWLFIALVMVTVSLSSCKKDPPKTKTKTEMISRAWKVNKALLRNLITQKDDQIYIIGGTANTENFEPYRLSFDATSFTRTNKDGSVTSGTWSFINNEGTVKLSTGVPTEVNIVSLSETELTISYVEENPLKNTKNTYTLSLIPL